MDDAKKISDLHPLVGAYEDAMFEILGNRTDRRRFHKLAKMCKQVQEVERLFAEARAESFRNNGDDEEPCEDDGGGFIINGNVGRMGRAIGGGEPQDMLREMATLLGPLLDGQVRRTRAEACRESASALAELCKTRSLMIAQSLPTGEIDDRINQLREELRHGGSVVPTLVLRGREADEDGQKTHEGIVGEADDAGEGGARRAGEPGLQEVAAPRGDGGGQGK